MDFRSIIWLFRSHIDNRGIIRMNLDEAGILWDAVKASSGPILELGRANGGSTTLMSVASNDERVITSVDFRQTQNPHVRDFIKDRQVRIVCGNTQNTISGEWGMILVDGNHTFDGVKADVLAHWDNAVQGALIVFHDAEPSDTSLNRKGVKKVVDYLLDQKIGGSWGTAGSTHVLVKNSNLPSDFGELEDDSEK